MVRITDFEDPELCFCGDEPHRGHCLDRQHASRTIDVGHSNRMTHGERVDRPRPEEHSERRVTVQTQQSLRWGRGQGHIVKTPSTRIAVRMEIDFPMGPAVGVVHWYACFTMAKAKRRKLRARRSKANHGRKPNAGRG